MPPDALKRYGIESAQSLITDVGLDVTLSEKHVYNLTSQQYLEIHSAGQQGAFVTVPPHATISVLTNERIRLGEKLGGLVASKVRMVSYGYSHISTTIDPGWDGQLVLTFTNTLPRGQNLTIGHKIATIVLFESVSAIPYKGEQPEVSAEKVNKIWTRYAQEATIASRLRRRRNIYLAFSALIILLSLAVQYLDIETIQAYEKTITIAGGVGSAIGGALAIISLYLYLKDSRRI
ncbi:hypothetical protein BC358_05635 [Hydrogenophaga sp. H7]|nr:hypothetical protein BC358_05635 [Hydrogenophaga sp. H7]